MPFAALVLQAQVVFDQGGTCWLGFLIPFSVPPYGFVLDLHLRQLFLKSFMISHFAESLFIPCEIGNSKRGIGERLCSPRAACHIWAICWGII